MNVASLELCKELYELSGWEDTVWSYYYSEEDDTVMNLSDPYKVVGGVGLFDKQYPAYDLGYLLRKLSSTTLRKTAIKHTRKYDPNGVWVARTFDKHTEHAVFADTPEEAICKLAIELFKQGVLK